MKEVLTNNDKMFALYEADDGSLVLRVVCGGVAMYEMEIPLRADEAARFASEGESFIEELAYDVARNSSKYLGRSKAP